MEVLLQDCTGAANARILPNCTATFFSLSFGLPDCTGAATNQPDDDGCCCCFFKPKTDLFKYYYHTIITLSHSVQLRPLLLQTPKTRSSFFSLTEGNFYLQIGKCFPSTLLTTMLNFKSPAGGEDVT